jgi:ankyrin repeat protein
LSILIQGGFDINKPTSAGSTYLHDAALKGQRKMAQLLLDRGAHVNALNLSGGTPLHDAALGGSTDVIDLLLNRGAKVDVKERESAATPLMLAASVGQADAVAVLLERGANPALRDRAGHTALDRAKESSDERTVKLLETSLGRSKSRASGKAES